MQWTTWLLRSYCNDVGCVHERRPWCDGRHHAQVRSLKRVPNQFFAFLPECGCLLLQILGGNVVFGNLMSSDFVNWPMADQRCSSSNCATRSVLARAQGLFAANPSIRPTAPHVVIIFRRETPELEISRSEELKASKVSKLWREFVLWLCARGCRKRAKMTHGPVCQDCSPVN
jgi:hypothetical protein